MKNDQTIADSDDDERQCEPKDEAEPEVLQREVPQSLAGVFLHPFHTGVFPGEVDRDVTRMVTVAVKAFYEAKDVALAQHGYPA